MPTIVRRIEAGDKCITAASATDVGRHALAGTDQRVSYIS